MAQTLFSITGRRQPVMMSAAATLVAASLVGWAAPGAAQTAVGAEMRLADLEKAFWACDHAATTRRVDVDTAVTCVALTDTLKLRKFNGDFNAMLAWWRQHKEAEHLALAAADRNAFARLAPSSPQ